jgi:hypothetical protein
VDTRTLDRRYERACARVRRAERRLQIGRWLCAVRVLLAMMPTLTADSVQLVLQELEEWACEEWACSNLQ